MDKVQFLEFIEEYLKTTKMSPSAFGLRYALDPSFVFDLRRGREARETKKETVFKKVLADFRGSKDVQKGE